jgi:hypothetical protein
MLSVGCSCGVTFLGWVMPEQAMRELVLSDLGRRARFAASVTFALIALLVAVVALLLLDDQALPPMLWAI